MNELDKCIDSLLAQTFNNFEVILVDDGSTDGSGARCEEWVSRDSRVRVVHKPNGGLSSARNAGIDVARSPYLGFVDSDDYVETDMYAVLYNAISNRKADMVCCGRFVHTGIEVQERFTAEPGLIFSRDDAIREVLVGNRIDVSACDKLYKRSLFEGIRYPEGRVSEDVAVILPLLSRANKVVHVGSPLYHYVFRSGSISKAAYSHKKFDVMTNCVEMRAFAKVNLPAMVDLVDSFCCTQMAAMIEDVINTPHGRNHYAADYRAYWNLFRETYPAYRSIKGHEHKESVRIMLTRAHLYRLFWMLREARNEVKRHVR